MRLPTQTATRRISKWVENKYVVVSTEIGEIAIEIDEKALGQRLGERALSNKSGTSQLLDGLIKAQVRSRRTVQS